MPNRKYQAGEAYRYGFNGKENDPETGTQDYGLRIYDGRIAKFLSVDPLAKDYPWNSAYSFGEGDVIRSIDLDGREKQIIIYKFTNDAITKTVIDLPNSGELGDGILVKIEKDGTSNYMYGEAKATDKKTENITGYDASIHLRELHEVTEGKKNEYYLDSEGLPTIGIGHLIKDNEKDKYKVGTKLTDDEVADLYSSDMSTRESAIDALLKSTDLTQNQGDAVFDFHYNTGRANEYLTGGKNSYFFLRYMAGGRGIWKRRIIEQLMYEQGVYINFDFKKADFKKTKTGTKVSVIVDDAQTDENNTKTEEEYDKTQKIIYDCDAETTTPTPTPEVQE